MKRSRMGERGLGGGYSGLLMSRQMDKRRDGGVSVVTASKDRLKIRPLHAILIFRFLWEEWLDVREDEGNHVASSNASDSDA
jgi:hypothetical protein